MVVVADVGVREGGRGKWWWWPMWKWGKGEVVVVVLADVGLGKGLRGWESGCWGRRNVGEGGICGGMG